MERRPKAFFLFGDGQMQVEPNIVEAAGYMEPIDVEGGEYEDVLDDTGRRYEASVVDGTTRLALTEVVDLEGLKRRLSEHASVNLEGFDPDSPVRAAAAISQWEWEHRWPRWPGWLRRRLHDSRPPIVDEPFRPDE